MRSITRRQLGELVGMFAVFISAVIYGIQHIHQVDYHLWAFLAASWYAVWVIGFHMKSSLWPSLSSRVQLYLRRTAVALLATILAGAIVSVTASAAVANAPTLPEGPPCSAVYSPYAPLCSFSSEA